MTISIKKSLLIFSFLVISTYTCSQKRMLVADQPIFAHKIKEETSAEEIRSLKRKIAQHKKELRSQAKNWNDPKKREVHALIKYLEMDIRQVKAQKALAESRELKSYLKALEDCKETDYNNDFSNFFEDCPSLTRAIDALQQSRTYKNFKNIDRKKKLLFIAKNASVYLIPNVTIQKLDQDIEECENTIALHKKYLQSPAIADDNILRAKAIRTYIATEETRLARNLILKELLRRDAAKNYLQILQQCTATKNCDYSLELAQAISSLKKIPEFNNLQKKDKEFAELSMDLEEQLFRDRLDEPYHFPFIDAIDAERYTLIPNSIPEN